MLTMLAIGDAYGAGFEFSDPEHIKSHNNLRYYLSSPGISPGCYTDDTQLSLALSELLISGRDWSPERIADAFIQAYQRDPRPGYAPGFNDLLASASSGAELLGSINPDSERNGAAMRSTPLGVLQDIDELLECAELQASITHNTEIGIKSAQAMALAMHYALYKLGPMEQLADFVSEHSHYFWSPHWQGRVDCCGWQTVNAVLTVLSGGSDLAEVLYQSVAFGGDVDTVAALSLSIASSSGLFENNLPSFLVDELERGRYGFDYLQEIDLKLAARKK